MIDIFKDIFSETVLRAVHDEVRYTIAYCEIQTTNLKNSQAILLGIIVLNVEL